MVPLDKRNSHIESLIITEILERVEVLELVALLDTIVLQLYELFHFDGGVGDDCQQGNATQEGTGHRPIRIFLIRCPELDRLLVDV